jgi:ferrochelatase
VERIKERYRLIGGRSPLPEITWGQAKALEERLKAKGLPFKSYVGMRYGHPLIEETLKGIFQDGISKVIAIPMAPFQSRESTGAYIEEVKRVQKSIGERLEISFVVGWHLHPLFLEAVRERVREGLMEFTPKERKRAHLIFTAHSLPKTMIESDPYIRDFEASVKRVLEGIEPLKWHIAFQSKGGGAGEWIGPDAESVLSELAKRGVREVLIVPIGFVSDHIEILYDIDILFQEKAESLGMVLKRTGSLNVSGKFIEAMATIVEEQIKGKNR